MIHAANLKRKTIEEICVKPRVNASPLCVYKDSNY